MSEADRHSVLAMVTFYGGRYQARLNSKCSHLVTPGPFGVSNLLTSYFYGTHLSAVCTVCNRQSMHVLSSIVTLLK